jgi:hypothetical protein
MTVDLHIWKDAKEVVFYAYYVLYSLAFSQMDRRLS